MELALDVDNASGTGFAGEKFQSLFSWNLLLMFLSSKQHIICRVVSILVFVELALDECSMLHLHHHCCSVSILVFVELALDGQKKELSCHHVD